MSWIHSEYNSCFQRPSENQNIYVSVPVWAASLKETKFNFPCLLLPVWDNSQLETFVWKLCCIFRKLTQLSPNMWRDLCFDLVKNQKLKNLWKRLQKWDFLWWKVNFSKKTSFWLASLAKEASNLSEIRCFSHDFWSIMNNIVTRIYFFHKTQSVSWLFG